MSPSYRYLSRYTASSGYASTTAENKNSNETPPWWQQHSTSLFNTRPALSERVSEYVKRSNSNLVGVTEHKTHNDQTAIINSLEFTRALGIYYNGVVLLLPVGIFAVRKLGRKTKAWKKSSRKGSENKQGEVVVVEPVLNASSSSSSASDIPIDAADESKPLLSASKQPRMMLYSRRIKGWLGNQASNDIRRRVRGTNGIEIAKTLLGLITYFLCLYWIYFPLDTTNNAGLRFFLLADRFGLIFTMNQPLNYLLAAKTSPIKHLTGWSYEQLNIFHRQLSSICYYLSILHFAGMYGVYLIFIAPVGNTSFLHVLSRPDIFIGVISFAAFFFFNIVSTDTIRERLYEFFLASHIIFSAIAMGFLYFHHPTARIYVVLSLSIWLVDRIVYRFIRKRWEAEAIVERLDESTVRVTIANVAAKRDGLNGWRWEPASHLFLTVPSWSRWQAHPFTILSPPPGYDLSIDRDEENRKKDMVLVIRKLQGFSAGLFDIADPQGKVRVVIDGPYGSSHAREVMEKSRRTVLVAGGSGIAVAWPLMVEVIRKRIDKARAGKRSKGRKIVLLWVVQFEHHLRWIDDDLAELERLKQESIIPRGVEVEVKKFVTKGPNGRRPDLKREIEDVVEDEDSGRSTVVVCGPDGMVRDVRATGYDLLWRGKDVEIVAEKFGW